MFANFRWGFAGGELNPIQELNPALWLADTGTDNGQWDDLSGNGRHATQGTAGAQPAIVAAALNGRQVRRFAGSQWLTITGSKTSLKFLHGSACDVFAVVKYGTMSNPATIYTLLGSCASSGSYIGVFLGYEDRTTVTNANNAAVIDISPGGGNRVAWHFNVSTSTIFTGFNNLITPNQYNLIRYSLDATAATAANRAKVSVNGAVAAGNQTYTATRSTADSSYDIQIGAHGNNGITLVGDIAEIIIFPTALSADDRLTVTNYLNSKYAIY